MSVRCRRSHICTQKLIGAYDHVLKCYSLRFVPNTVERGACKKEVVHVFDQVAAKHASTATCAHASTHLRFDCRVPPAS